MIGFGYDIHRLERGRRMTLGGVEIPCERGPAGHSDGDALLHALCDALLGAAALGDIGAHFSDSAEEFKGISSLELLRRVAALLREKQLSVVNVDATVVLERPKLAPHISRMGTSIASVLDLPPERISVKAKTNEGTGVVGAGEAVAAFAVAQVERAFPHR